MTALLLPYVQLDVFTSQALTGNPLAVFTDARALSDAQLQALARETNLSETTFVFPRPAEVEAQYGIKVRIFTPREEFPFAGHPTLGTAFYLHTLTGAPLIELDLPVGKIPVTFAQDEKGLTFGEMQQRDPEFGEIYSPQTIAEATGLQTGQLDTSLPIQRVSTGLPFIIIPLRSVADLSALRFDFQHFVESLDDPHIKPYFVVRQRAGFRARMIFYQGEDPATGSAAGCCAAWAVRHGLLESGRRAIIEQGCEIHRPSRIFIQAETNGKTVTNVRVGGHAFCVFRGEAQIA